MGYCDFPLVAADHHGLSVLEFVAAVSAVTNVANSGVRQAFTGEVPLEDRGNHTEVLIGDSMAVFTVSDTGAFLSSVLEGEKRKKEVTRDIRFFPGKNACYSAGVVKTFTDHDTGYIALGLVAGQGRLYTRLPADKNSSDLRWPHVSVLPRVLTNPGRKTLGYFDRVFRRLLLPVLRVVPQ